MLRAILFTGLFLGAVFESHAQHSAYEKSSLDFGSSVHLINNNFTRHWAPKLSIYFGGSTKFYVGNLEVGARLSRYIYYNPKESGADFFSGFLYLGWEYPIKLAPHFFFSPGIRFGNNLMVFDDAKTYSNPYDYTFDSTESEFAYELIGRVEYNLKNVPWKINAGVSFNKTLTYYPLPATLFSVGISHTFDTPTWLKDFLK